jgi:hypothetical protein
MSALHKSWNRSSDTLALRRWKFHYVRIFQTDSRADDQETVQPTTKYTNHTKTERSGYFLTFRVIRVIRG